MAISEVRDEEGRVYELTEGYKKGGQGRVYAVKDGQFVVKVVEGQDRESLRRQLDFVKRLPLDELPVTRPLEMLREPHVGYVMELLSGMKPIDELIRPKHSDSSPSLDWYAHTGGLQRRLRILARCARVLSQLHGKALVYSDLSPNNVFVSDDPAHNETWLIDVDNLQYESNSSSRYIHTPGYGAPEIVSGRSGVNSLSDAFSLAVMIFEVLAAVHPFEGGDLVEQGDPDLLAAARRGEISWIDAPDDDRNRSSLGITRSYVLSPRLEDLARRAFVNGLHDPLLRPKPSEWAERLEIAADATIQCPVCASTFYRSQTTCPWCQQPRPIYLRLSVHVCWPEVQDCLPGDDKDINSAIASLTAAISDTPTQIIIPNRIVTGRYDRFADQPVVEVIAGKREIHVRLLADREFFMVSEDGQRIEQLTHRAVHFPYRWRLHMGRLDQLHRVIHFTEPWRRQ